MIRNLLINILLLGMSFTGSAQVVGIMATDSEELGDIISLMENHTQVTRGKRTFYKGKLWDTDTIVFLSNCGKAAAASATVEIINEGADCIVFFGTAGALDKRLNIGDVVISKNLLSFDVDFRPFTPLYTLPFKERAFTGDKDLQKVAFLGCDRFLRKDIFAQIDKETLLEMHIEKPKVIEASIGTADHFLISEKEISDLSCNAPEIVCVEMEGAAIAEIAKNYGVPFVIIRTISNYIDSPDSAQNLRVSIDYMQFLKKIQSVYSKNLLSQFFLQFKSVEKHTQPFSSAESKGKTIGILCVQQEEAEALCKMFQEPPQVSSKGGYLFYRGKVGNHDIVIVPSGWGKASGAAVATELILNEKSECLIEIGSALSCDKNVKAGDIVISSSFIECDVDVRPFRPLFQLPTIGITDLPAEDRISQIVYNQCISDFLYSPRNIHIGQIATGDKWMNEDSRMILKQGLHALLCVDTQAAAESQIAYQYHIPFVSIKSIVDEDLFARIENPNLVKILHNTILSISSFAEEK